MKQYDFIDDWVKIATKAKEEVLATARDSLFDEQCRKCEKLAVKLSLEHLQEYPYVKEGLHKKTLQLWGVYYDFVMAHLCFGTLTTLITISFQENPSRQQATDRAS
ncbi:Carbonic anhydrase, chloroplastic-like protein [Drosera capensis]